MIRLKYIGLIVCLMLLPGLMKAQETASPEAVSPEVAQLKLEIETRLSQFSDELNQLFAVCQMPLSFDGNVEASQSLISAMEQRMNYLNQSYNTLDVKWNTYYQAQLMDIANDEDLMEKVASFEGQKQVVKDSLDAKTQAVEAVMKFVEADKYIISQVSIYKSLYKKAYQLSLLQKLAPQLEKVKAKEQIVFGELQKNYEQAKASTELVPTLSKRMDVLDGQFVIMKSVSEKVQALEYKPFVQRVKDYVLGFAAVAIILLFLNGILTKFNAYRDKVANLKKYKEMMNNQGQGTNYPTI
jgi:hypothetical protein